MKFLSRPKKRRRVCSLPDNKTFGPLVLGLDEQEYINMTVDEYETIRLIDLEDFTQEDCSKQMNVARTTIQGIYREARRKMAESLVNGKVIRIDGGEYHLCDGSGSGCGLGCRKGRRGRQFRGNKNKLN